MRFEQQIGEIQNREMQACPQEFGRYQNRNHGGDNLKRGGEMAIDPMGLMFTKIHPKTCCFVLMDGCIAGCWVHSGKKLWF